MVRTAHTRGALWSNSTRLPGRSFALLLRHVQNRCRSSHLMYPGVPSCLNVRQDETVLTAVSGSDADAPADACDRCSADKCNAMLTGWCRSIALPRVLGRLKGALVRVPRTTVIRNVHSGRTTVSDDCLGH